MATGNGYPEPSGPDDPESSGGAVDVGRPSEPMRVVGVGASAGGLTALKQFFASVPEDPGVCFVVVVHLSPEHESHLADLLQTDSRLPVEQVTHDTALEANHIYVIPPGVNLEAIDTHVRLSELEQQRQERAPIDHFFRTLAEAHGEQAVGVVLTGTGSDGTLGLKRIREHGGLTLVQSPDEAEHDAMPRSAIAAGAADLVLPLDQITGRILQANRAAPRVAVVNEDAASAEKADQAVQKILVQVQNFTGHDFTHYKRSTILRRIRRRMQLHRVEQLGDYLQVLRDQDDEVGLLFEDLLITVTEFFRDPKVFERLESEVVPHLFKDKERNDRVRVWSVGCATGEEAYTLAMLLLEERGRRANKAPRVQVFATDLHEPALRKAREGVYPASIEANVSPQRLATFFSKENGIYRVRKEVRENIVFARHNVTQDPPFSHLQLILCRNLLIYLQRDVQHQLMALFHYALAEDGYLLVGTAEGVDSDLFVCESKEHGLYRRRSVPAQKPRSSSFPLTSGGSDSDAQQTSRPEPVESYGALHEQVVERYAPPSVLINPEGELVHSSARAGRFLQVPGGTPTNNVYRLLPEPLRFELRTAIHTAHDRGGGYRSRPVTFSDNEHAQRQVVLRVQPIEQPQMTGFFLVIFDELEEETEKHPDDVASDTQANVYELKSDLAQAKKRMQALIEEHEAAQERAQAYNEELESTNEELRSTMEELETSKEEMQSMNEELTTLNQQNQQKVEELDRLSSDLNNLLTATDIATVFLDRQMRILRFTPSMAELFNLRDSDRGRALTELTHHLDYEQLQPDFQHVIEQLTPTEREVASEQGRWFLTRLQCYRTSDDRIEGVVITFIDITERKQAEERIREAKHVAEEVMDTVRNPMLVLNDDLRVRDVNKAFDQMFGVQEDEIEGRLVYDLNQGQWDIPELRTLLEKILPENETMENFELEHEFERLGRRVLLLNARRIDHLQLILLAIEDVTERRQAQHSLENSRDALEQQVRERTAQLHQQTQRLQHLVRELSSAEQRERKRMAAVLHDELQQLLVGVKMQLDMARQPRGSESVGQSLEQAARNLDEAIETTRTLVRQVAPQALYEEGLIPALHWLSEEMSRRHGLAVQTDAPESDPPLNDETRPLLFESVREMLFNVVKHAQVNEAAVHITQDQQRLSITVSDQGIGFDVGTKAVEAEQSGFGLFSVSDRIEAMGGRCSIESAPGKGTRTCIEVPLSDAAFTNELPDLSTATETGHVVASKANQATERPLRVLVVDDHALVREGVVNILSQHPEVGVVDEAADGVQAVTAVEQHQPDIVLMDVNMPRMNGIEATRQIRQRWPGTLVIGLSVQDKDGDGARAMTDAGAAAFLTKSDDSGQMVQTILHLVQGGS